MGIQFRGEFLSSQDFEEIMARFARLQLTQLNYDHGNIDLKQAKEILSGCLEPGNETTRRDDSAQLKIKGQNA